MSGVQIVSVRGYVTSGGGLLDGDDAQEFTFTFECGNWKTDLSDLIADQALAYIEKHFPGEELIETELLGMTAKPS